jgi:hypothetical protein
LNQHKSRASNRRRGIRAYSAAVDLESWQQTEPVPIAWTLNFGNQGQDQTRSHRKAASLLDGWRPEPDISDSRYQLGIDAQTAIYRVKPVERCDTDETRRRLECGFVGTIEMMGRAGVDISFWRTLTFFATAIA